MASPGEFTHGRGLDNASFEYAESVDPHYPANTSATSGHVAEAEVTSDNHATSDSVSDSVDELQKRLGGYGRYQLLLYVLLGLVYMRGGWHIWAPTFQVMEVDHHCSASPGLPLNQSVPAVCENTTSCLYQQCRQYVNLSLDNRTEACHNGWTYLADPSYTSVVSEFDLVCEDAYLVEFTSTIYMVGAAAGVLVLSPLADRLGAKKVMLGCLWVQTVFATCLIWSGHIAVFCVFKFIIGVTNMTVALCCYVLMTETFDSLHRTAPTIAMQFFWALGIMSIVLLGYLVPKWQHLQLIITLPVNILSVVYFFLVPESLPWLLSKGQTRQAEEVIKRFIKFNRLPPIPDLEKKLTAFKPNTPDTSQKESQPYNNGGYDNSEKTVREDNTEKHPIKVNMNSEKKEQTREDNPPAGEDNPPVYTVLALFKTRRLRIYTILMFYIFMINSLAYYGIMFSTPILDGDRFVNLFLLGVVEIPAYILCLISNRVIGRRRSIAVFLFICAVTTFVVIFIPDESETGADLTKLKTALVIIGKFGITGSYSTIYLYASEVFPTVIRNQGVGASSFFENLGSIAAPNMVYANKSLTNLPLAIFGGLTILGSGLVLLLPETHGRSLPQTIEDVERDDSQHSDKSTDVETGSNNLKNQSPLPVEGVYRKTLDN